MTDYTKHTTHTDALDTLGTILSKDDPNERDAIHLAVFKAEAAEMMGPGMDVYLDDEHKARWNQPQYGPEREFLGIVDPFLEVDLEPGDMFWLVVYPRQITSLRHVWEHPGFPGVNDKPKSKADAEAWLRDFAARSDVPSFESMVDAAVRGGGSYVGFGEDASGEIPPEFWDHLGVYTGISFEGATAEWFSCAC